MYSGPSYGKNNNVSMFTTRSELERWSQGIPLDYSLIPQDPLQCVDPWLQGADGGLRPGAIGGPCGYGTYYGNAKGQDWPYGTRALQ